MTTGFIGTGGITEAIVVGLYTCGEYEDRILISRRSRERSARLAARFPQIEVIEDNQALVYQCDQVILAVLPKDAASIIGELTFSGHQRVVSLVAGFSLSAIRNLVQPATQCFRAIPMPPVEFGLGPVPVCPPDPELMSLFNRVGDAIPLKDESLFNAFSTASASMATFFDLVANIARWMEKEKVPADQAARYVTSMMHALSKLTTQVTRDELQGMSQECLTPGGLNEQVLRGCRNENWTETLAVELDKVQLRLTEAESSGRGM